MYVIVVCFWRSCLSCSERLMYLSFQYFDFWGYTMKVIPETCRPHYIIIRPSRGGPYYVIGNSGRAACGGCAGVRPHRFPHNNFSSVYRIFTKFGHMIPLFWGHYVKGQGQRYYEYNFWQQGRFYMITLVLYIGSLPRMTTWLPCRRGRTLLMLGSLGHMISCLTELPLYRLIIYIDRCVLWCTHFLLLLLSILSTF